MATGFNSKDCNLILASHNLNEALREYNKYPKQHVHLITSENKLYRIWVNKAYLGN